MQAKITQIIQTNIILVHTFLNTLLFASRFHLVLKVICSFLCQVPDLCRDVLLKSGSGAGEFDEGDGCLVLVLVLGLYSLVVLDPELAVPAGWEAACLTCDCGQLVVAESVVNPLRLEELLQAGAGQMPGA